MTKSTKSSRQEATAHKQKPDQAEAEVRYRSFILALYRLSDGEVGGPLFELDVICTESGIVDDEIVRFQTARHLADIELIKYPGAPRGGGPTKYHLTEKGKKQAELWLADK